MRIFRSLEDYEKVRNPVVTIGTFDGVHIGHQKILDRLNTLARQKEGESLLLTFWPHPRLVLQPDNPDLKLLNTLNEKIELLERFGLQNVVVVPFTKEFSRLTAVEFIRDLLVNNLGTRMLVIGHDHRFGKNREGSFEDLQEGATTYGYEIEQIPPQEIDDVTVSSTKIRNALMEGDVSRATEFLNHYYRLKGKVITGDKLGRTMGYPTANIEVEEQIKLIPAEGVYLVRVFVKDQAFFGMLNIGNRPTVKANGDKRIEVYLFDFNEDIYGASITVEFLEWLRGDEHFPDMEGLKAQMDKDKENALALVPNYRYKAF